MCALTGIITEAFCVIYKIPDMNNNVSGAFVHVVDTLFGALIAMLINTRAQAPVPTLADVAKVVATPPKDVTVVIPPTEPVSTTPQTEGK